MNTWVLWNSPRIAVSLSLLTGIAGWFIPAIYDWSGSDQSRPSPVLWQGPLALACLVVLTCFALPWLPLTSWTNPDNQHARGRFGLGNMLVVTSGVALLLGIGARLPTASMILALVFTTGLVGRSWWVAPQLRVPIAALLGILYLPFAWILGYGELSNMMPEVLLLSLYLPGLFPAAVANYIVPNDIYPRHLLAAFLVCAEILFGLWLIHGGSRRTLAYFAFLSIACWLSALVLYALVRA
ncbi:MAG: hypothetical protein KDB03_01160 [Planctomycetales bacterium]|nr:hypothetical protein [Planctomycetales bacterium]